MGRECKRYLDRVAGRGTDAVAKVPCPYEGCGCEDVSYWGWYERKEGSIPYGDGDVVAGPIPIRRFRCSRCGRTFSWRPAFLVFGRRLVSVAYQGAVRAWALGHRRGRRRGGESWHELGMAGRKSLFRRLTRRLDELLGRLDVPGHSSAPDEPTGLAAGRQRDRVQLWHAARRLAHTHSSQQHEPRLACHLVFLALASHPAQVRYSLESA